VTAHAVTALAADDPAAHAAIRRARIARIVTVSPSGRPQIMPLWFALIDGRIHMSNAATSPTVHNIAREPRVLVLFEADGGRIVRVRGTARYLTDRGALRRLVRPSLTKYYFHPRALWLAVRNMRRLSGDARLLP
jgi:general stress protein 26